MICLIFNRVEESLTTNIIEVEINSSTQKNCVVLNECGEHVIIGWVRGADVQI